jgi:gliding motility-associated-like protein
MKCLPICLLISALVFYAIPANSQTNTYILNGSATQDNCNCYTLTNSSNSQSGSVWNTDKINLNNSFDFIFNVYLGCRDGNGADGIVFILQPISTSIGAVGGGMGFYGVTPSVGIALDTWQNQNLNDPSFDHISIQINGNSNHANDLAGPLQASVTSVNIEDCKWHTLRISWDASTHWLKAYFDNVLRVQAQVDLIATIFQNDPMVFWGFSASTGAYNNQQKFCTALISSFSTNLTNNAACIGNAVVFQNQSQSFAPIKDHYWDFGDGITSNAAAPAHIYSAPGLYTVKLTETGLDGCNSDTAKKIIEIGDYPIADFDIFDTCSGKPPRIIDRSSLAVGAISQWNWKLDGNVVSAAQSPQLTDISPGLHTLELFVSSNYGCSSSAVKKKFSIKPAPVISARAANGCVDVAVLFKAEQSDNATVITNWNWHLDNGQKSLLQNPIATYNHPGYYNVYATATGDNGCVSNTATIPLFINKAEANAGNDTVIIRNQPFQLQASGGVSYNWTPAIGLNNPAFANPVALLQDDATYTLSVTTAEGCEDDDIINLKIFRGSGITVPTAFTPNNDGLNETLKPIYRGIKKLDHFSIYNRWGQMVFSSNDMFAGWNGICKGVKQSTGVYIWSLRATDYAGKVYNLNSSFTLIR